MIIYNGRMTDGGVGHDDDDDDDDVIMADEMRSHGGEPTFTHYHEAMRACANAGQLDATLALLDDMVDRKIKVGGCVCCLPFLPSAANTMPFWYIFGGYDYFSSPTTTTTLPACLAWMLLFRCMCCVIMRPCWLAK